MNITDHIDHLRHEGSRLADAAARAGGDAPVPTCPDWSVRDLVLHIGEVHRWAAATLRSPVRAPGDEAEVASAVALAPPDFSDLVAWFREGLGALVEALVEADPAGDAWHFLPAPSGTAFWARRQAHETAMHRADAESANGSITPTDPAFAVDGLDELLLLFVGRPGGRLRSDQPCSLAIRATDTGDAWRVQIGPDRRVVTRDDVGAADCSVTGLAAALYLVLWNRKPFDAVQVEGDRSIADLWRAKSTITWGP